MKIRIFYQLRTAFCAFLCIASLLASPVVDAGVCIPNKTDEKFSLDSQSRKLVDALTGRIEDEDQRLDILHDAVRETEAGAGGRYFLAQRALLTLAGEQLQRGGFDKSRELLHSVKVDSPVAVEAALLLADSWRMQGDQEKAREWYLRAGKRFPHELLALKGMLAAGRAMEMQAPEVAATLYDRVHEQAIKSKEKLKQIPGKKMDAGLNWLLSDDHGLPPALHSQLSHRILKRGEKSLIALEEDREHSAVNLRCILRRAGDLEKVRGRVAGEAETLKRSIQAIETRMTQLEARTDTLESRVTPGEMGNAQIQLREELVRRENEHKRLKGQLIFLRQNREELPDMLNRLEQRIQQLHAEHDVKNRQVSRSIRSLVEKSMNALRNDFLDIAADAQNNKARLMEEAAATRE